MPIDPSVLQRRHWQDGRIRLGVKKISKNGKEYPSKIETFRFTSPSEEMIQGVAELYGGQARPWKSPQGPQFEVITDAKRIPVIVPPNGLSQNMELWDGKLCVRRCTGVAARRRSGSISPQLSTCCRPYVSTPSAASGLGWRVTWRVHASLRRAWAFASSAYRADQRRTASRGSALSRAPQGPWVGPSQGCIWLGSCEKNLIL
ncbi:hypothetical protein [Nonomuraea sp. NPDC049028]|uniref:recombination directionality factor n=1 Tax=Nonomuraea sp. NPDC049028 TaxID=3364348 RepID=UPI0037159E9F